MIYQTILFIDLDETVMRGPFEVILPAVLTDLANRAGLSTEEVHQLVRREHHQREQNPAVPRVKVMDWDDIMQTVAQQLDFSLPAETILEQVTARACPPHSQILDQADEVLSRLATPDRAVVAATKGLRKYQQVILDGLGLTSLFTDILTPDSFNSLKDGRAYYGDWPTKGRLKIMVGDRYDDDVRSPHKLGFKTVWKPQGNTETNDPFERARAFQPPEGETIRPEAIIFSLQELPAVVETLESRHL